MRKPSNKWHSVTVVLQQSSCAAAALCHNARFLAGAAPRLPLPKCAHPDVCPCTYRHFDDRRGAPAAGETADKRRVSRSRRSGDQR